MRLGIVWAVLYGLSEQRNRLFNASGISKEVCHVNPRSDESRIERNCFFKCRPCLAVILVSAELQRCIGRIGTAQICPCWRVAGLKKSWLLQPRDRSQKVVQRIEVDSTQIIFVSLRVDRRLWLKLFRFSRRKRQLQSLNNLLGNTVLHCKQFVEFGVEGILPQDLVGLNVN